MSREDIYKTYERGQAEVVELGIDHNGQKQWYVNARGEWHEVSLNGNLVLNQDYYKVGTRIELTETLEKETK